MAMRPRTPTSRTRTQPSIRPAYENFQPKSEMKENDQAYFLHIYLPGFIKERIKINFVASSRIVRVSGERPIVGGNKWSRFDQSYPVPENCEVEKLQGKFEQGILIVTMPKKFISPVTPKAQVEPTKENGSSPRIPKETIPSKSTTTKVEEPIGDKKSASSPRIVKGSNDLKEQKGIQKGTSPALIPKDISQKPIDNKGLRGSEPFVEPKPQNIQEKTVLKNKAIAATLKEQTGKTQKGQEEIEPKPTLTMDTTKQIDDEKRQEEIRQKTILETVKKQLHEKAEKESVRKKEDGIAKPYESRKPEKYVDQNTVIKGKEIKTRKESPKAAESSPEKGKGISSRTATTDRAKSNKEDEIYPIGKGIKELAASASQVVTRIGEGKLNDQEKPLVVNMGAAILVIVALGAYVSYKFTSSSRT
ncbi:HSP20-like chaperone [Sesbania bispinosa]|nr:HSP20-like chaperone [Sesbania bispinosa]